jgi:DUF917 family protein
VWVRTPRRAARRRAIELGWRKGGGMGKVENIDHSAEAAGAAESLQALVNKRAWELAKGEYQRLRRLLSADLMAGRVRIEGIDSWRPTSTEPGTVVDTLDDLPL